MADPRFNLFRDWAAVQIADEMGWSFEDLVEYAKKTYSPVDVELATSGCAEFRFHRFMSGDMRLAQQYNIKRLDALSVFATSTHFADRRDPDTGGVYPENMADVLQAAHLLARIGWENVAEATVVFSSLFYEDCRWNVETYLDAGVSGRFICHVPVTHPGGEAFDVEEALFLEKHSVPPEYAAGFIQIGGAENLTDTIVEMWQNGIPLEYARA